MIEIPLPGMLATIYFTQACQHRNLALQIVIFYDAHSYLFHIIMFYCRKYHHLLYLQFQELISL